MQAVVFDPLLPLPLIAALAALAPSALALALWRGLTGWWLRGLAALVLLVALAGPSLRQEDRRRCRTSPSWSSTTAPRNRIDGRDAQLAAALDGAGGAARPAGRRPARSRCATVHVADRGEDGTRLLTALAEAAAELPADRIAGAILRHRRPGARPAGARRAFPAPVQVLLTGSADDWDRRVVVETAPAFAIVDEAVSLVLRVEDLGRRAGGGGVAPLADLARRRRAAALRRAA